MRSHPRSSLYRLAAVMLAAGLVITVPAKSASAAVDPDTLIAALSGDNIPDPGGDTGGGGTFSLALDAAQTKACFVIDVTLTDLADDPPTGVTVVDTYSDELLLSMPTSVDATGHASGCVAASVPVIDALFAKPDRYQVDVQTTSFAVALRGSLRYSYEVNELEVFT